MLRWLLIIGIILLVLWLLGLILNFIAGPLLWILLVIAVVLLIIWLVQRVRIRK
jgi:antibiotic biosynthesis monooxygenase (ABM) superfamily enzyme